MLLMVVDLVLEEAGAGILVLEAAVAAHNLVKITTLLMV
jgi:hypothetical protein